MKTNFFKSAFIALASILMLSTVMISCKPQEVETANTTALKSLIDSCQTLADNATLDDYPQEAITAFKGVLKTAKAALDNKLITQTAVDNLVVQLRAARKVFLAAAYGAIPEEALVMGLSFEEGTGTQLTAAGKKWTAVLKKGPAEIFDTNTGVPTFVDGKVGKAMSFDKGSHLQIDNYTTADLLGKTLSIAVWLKPAKTRPGNYVISYNYWKTWKFQVQAHNKPFFTVATNNGVTDADNELVNSVPNNEWTHVVVVLDLNAEKLYFYINGRNSFEWTVTGKPNLKGSIAAYDKTLPLLIGTCTTYAEAKTAFDWSGWDTVDSWDYFVGAMDELKVYNIALTEGQVAKLYKTEK